MLNKVLLIGRLTADPELRYTTAGTPLGTFTLAVRRPYAQEEQPDTDFIDVVLWRKTAEVCAEHLTKGRMVAVEGWLQLRKWEGSDGRKRRVLEVVAQGVQFLDRPSAPETLGESVG
ncbi:MAG: single-stranded DNA-binding protein [Thermaerobacter sp.]|nr:single-stranded DNA-binding protein [Thermaerobacter sp.]